MLFSLKTVPMVGLSALCLSMAIETARAATINWGSVKDIVDASDVDSTGTLFASANFTSQSPGSDVTVNGQVFTAFAITNGATSATVGNITLTGTSSDGPYSNLRAFDQAGGPASYNGLLNGVGYVYNTPSPLQVSISGLTSDYQYLIQYWVNDSRFDGIGRTTIIDGNALAANLSGFGQYITGTFTATSSTQSFDAIQGNGLVAYANAMQVRLLAVPEPSAIAILIGAVGSFAGLRLRRSIKVTFRRPRD